MVHRGGTRIFGTVAAPLTADNSAGWVGGHQAADISRGPSLSNSVSLAHNQFAAIPQCEKVAVGVEKTLYMRMGMPTVTTHTHIESLRDFKFKRRRTAHYGTQATRQHPAGFFAVSPHKDAIFSIHALS